MLRVVLNGKEYEVQEGKKLGDFFKEVGIEGALGAKLGGTIIDLQTPIRESGELVPIYRQDPESLEVMRHSLSHIMAQALKEIYGREVVHLGVGPTTEEGFYYDVEVEGTRIREEDLPKIEQKMKEIIERNYPILRRELDRDSALRLFEKLKEHYKLDIIRRIDPHDVISVYEQGDFIDLCRGPHVPSTGTVGAFKLTHIAGAYWQGDPSKPMLQRIYGIAYWDTRELEERLKFYEEVKRRDHRKLGAELEMFLIDEDIGGGLVLWLPKGGAYRKVLEDFLEGRTHKEGLSTGLYTPCGKGKPMANQRALRVLPSEHVSTHGDGAGGILCQTYELSFPCGNLQEQGKEL
jgi:threonyl-tRNA synthetase